MKNLKEKLSIAVVQAEPVNFNAIETCKKTVSLIEEAAKNNVEMVIFPELFVPGYPLGLNFGFVVGARREPGREDWKKYYDNSILVDGEEMQMIKDSAKENGVYVSLGYSERDSVTGTLYNSNIFISPEGETIFNHRKLKPTGSKRVVWGDANKEYFPVAETPWGRAGSLICWESYMPLARVALYKQGISLYIAPNTNDNPEWQDTIKHIALEGRCYVINANLYCEKDSYQKDYNAQDEIEVLPDIVNRGGSCIIDPYGHYVTEPLWDKEGIIYAELDMTKVPASKMELDVCGHYSRDDVLKFEFSRE